MMNLYNSSSKLLDCQEYLETQNHIFLSIFRINSKAPSYLSSPTATTNTRVTLWSQSLLGGVTWSKQTASMSWAYQENSAAMVGTELLTHVTPLYWYDIVTDQKF